MLGRSRDVVGMELMRRCDVDRLDRAIAAQLVDRRVGRRLGKILAEARARLGARVSAGHHLDQRMQREGGQHQAEGAAQSGDAEAQPSLTHGRCPAPRRVPFRLAHAFF